MVQHKGVLMFKHKLTEFVIRRTDSKKVCR